MPWTPPCATARLPECNFRAPCLPGVAPYGPARTPHWECFRLWLGFVDREATLPIGHGSSNDGGPMRLKDLAERSGVSTSTLRRRLMPDGGFRQTRSGP